MARKKKTLPKDFKDLIEQKDLEALKKVFDTCEPDARGGYGKSTALSFYGVPAELVSWLVEKGADMEAVDNYQRTALHKHAGLRGSDISPFLELGANVHATDTYGDTPLHFAAGSGFNAPAIKALLAHGADATALNMYKQTPLEYALARANNIDLVSLVQISKLLLPDKNAITQKMKDLVTRKGEDFEFHRAGFNKDYLAETEAALTALYGIFEVAPVKKRIMHDGVSPITVTGTTWQKQFEELWELLVPSSGSAATMQGEVVRIAGKIKDEIYRNGGGNWDVYFKKMVDAFGGYLSAGNALSQVQLQQVQPLLASIRKRGDAETDELHFLCELATQWVLLNPKPIALDGPNYKR